MAHVLTSHPYRFFVAHARPPTPVEFCVGHAVSAHPCRDLCGSRPDRRTMSTSLHIKLHTHFNVLCLHRSGCVCFCLFLAVPGCLCLFLSALPACLSVHPNVCPSVCVSVWLDAFLSVCLSLCLCHRTSKANKTTGRLGQIYHRMSRAHRPQDMSRPNIPLGPGQAV